MAKYGGDPQVAINALRRAGFRGAELTRAVAIVKRESNFDPTAKNLNAATRDHSIGFGQINQLAHKGRFGTDEQLQDPDTNARAMRTLYKQAGWQPWTTNSAVNGLDLDEARKIVGSGGSSSPSYGVGRQSGVNVTPATPGTAPGIDKKGAVIDALLNRPKGTSLAGAMVSNIASGRFNTPGTPGTPAQVSGGGGSDGPVSSGGKSGELQAMIDEANRIDAAKMPYEWGGGHGRKLIRGKDLTPVDCSGAVSQVLGIDPRVSGALASWGAPGKGKSVTIYANATHVLMEIDGHFWGTSKSNPGGGAGWIPSSAVSAAYLSKFTARHPPGM